MQSNGGSILFTCSRYVKFPSIQWQRRRRSNYAWNEICIVELANFTPYHIQLHRKQEHPMTECIANLQYLQNRNWQRIGVGGVMCFSAQSACSPHAAAKFTCHLPCSAPSWCAEFAKKHGNNGGTGVRRCSPFSSSSGHLELFSFVAGSDPVEQLVLMHLPCVRVRIPTRKCCLVFYLSPNTIFFIPWGHNLVSAVGVSKQISASALWWLPYFGWGAWSQCKLTIDRFIGDAPGTGTVSLQSLNANKTVVLTTEAQPP